jgi:hypothetical protein
MLFVKQLLTLLLQQVVSGGTLSSPLILQRSGIGMFPGFNSQASASILTSI